MKVGTDGVLLGAWAGEGQPQTILDIGTGTGLIALQLAQRFENAEIHGVEPNELAIANAQENFSRSPFKSRLKLFRGSLSDFKTEIKYDLVVSNPPFYVDALDSPDRGRAQARTSYHLSPDQLAEATKWLNQEGSLAVIYPVSVFTAFAEAMFQQGWNPGRIMQIKSTPKKEFHRIMGEFVFGNARSESSEMIIEEHGRHQYSQEYIKLTRDFYLHLD